MNANPISTVGLMLTLAGLVGTFFNIQLSQWLRDLVALEQKATLNKFQAGDAQQKAIVECKIELKKLSNSQTYIINFLVLGFVIFVIVNGLLMIRAATADPLYPYVNTALWVFFFFFVSVSGWLTYSGHQLAEAIRKILS